jgi:L-threonylcarbamoyladenylate synthase
MTATLTTEDDLSPLLQAFLAGRATIVPTDTVYGLATGAHQADACARLVALKGRDLSQPSAIVCGSVASLLEVLPETPPQAAARVEQLLPGPLTLVLPNPGRRFEWLCGDAPDRIGVRVPDLHPRLAATIHATGAVLATSANRTGAPAPHRLDDVDPELLAEVDVAVDGGPAGGIASTVVDVTGPEPAILREGPIDLEEIQRRIGQR